VRREALGVRSDRSLDPHEIELRGDGDLRDVGPHIIGGLTTFAIGMALLFASLVTLAVVLLT
jgi:hypothetical protein